MTSNSIYIIGKFGGGERKVAECDYGDDAQLLFQSYKDAGYACRVVFHSSAGDQVTLKCEERS